MKMTVDVDNPQLFLSALNNAIITYNQLYSSVFFCCEIPTNFERFFNENNLITSEDRCKYLKKRLAILHKVYNELDNQCK